MTFDIVSLFKDEVEMAQEDLVAMEFALEDYYSGRIAENVLYFNGSPAQLLEANQQILMELDTMNDEFIDKEHYEKCSVVKKVGSLLKSKIEEVNNIS